MELYETLPNCLVLSAPTPIQKTFLSSAYQHATSVSLSFIFITGLPYKECCFPFRRKLPVEENEASTATMHEFFSRNIKVCVLELLTQPSSRED